MIFGLLCFLVLIWLPYPVSAISTSGVYITPSMVNIEIEKDQETKDVELVFGNNTSDEITFELSVIDFNSMDESGGIAFLAQDKDKTSRKYSLTSWLVPEKNSVTVLPGKTEKVKVSVINKESLSPGGHYGAVLAHVKSSSDKNISQVELNQSISSLLYVLKKGGEVRELKLNNYELDGGMLKLPGELKMRFQNSGNVHLVPRGKVEIVNQNNKLIAKGIINETSSYIFPESFRNFVTEIERYEKLNWPGIYNVKLEYRYDGQETSIVKNQRIFYFGREGVATTIVVLLIVVFVIKKNRKTARI